MEVAVDHSHLRCVFGSFFVLFHAAARTRADITSNCRGQCHRCATLLMVRHSYCVQRVDQRSKKKLIPYRQDGRRNPRILAIKD